MTFTCLFISDRLHLEGGIADKPLSISFSKSRLIYSTTPPGFWTGWATVVVLSIRLHQREEVVLVELISQDHVLASNQVSLVVLVHFGSIHGAPVVP